MQKLEICSVTYPFDAAAMADTQLMAKRELKRQALLEIIDYINTKNVLTDDKICIACVTMVSPRQKHLALGEITLSSGCCPP